MTKAMVDPAPPTDGKGIIHGEFNVFVGAIDGPAIKAPMAFAGPGGS